MTTCRWDEFCYSSSSSTEQDVSRSPPPRGGNTCRWVAGCTSCSQSAPTATPWTRGARANDCPWVPGCGCYRKREAASSVDDAPDPPRCVWPTCTYRAVDVEDMQHHMQREHAAQVFRCPYGACAFTTTIAVGLRTHIERVHLEDYSLKQKCSYDGCSYTTIKGSHMKRHELRHTDHKTYSCKEETCGYKSSTWDTMMNHYRRQHVAVKPYPCTFKHCDYAFAYPGELKRHIQCWHTKEGMNRKKRQENRVRTLLNNTYVVDEELHIQYQKGCVQSPDKYCARVDFSIVSIFDTCVIVECDESAHESYLLKCELTRMEQIHESILTGGETRPVLFVRYNPDGTYKEDGITVRIPRWKREERLLEVLEKIKEGRIVFTKPLNILYLFYELKKGKEAILEDRDFSQQMLGCVCRL